MGYMRHHAIIVTGPATGGGVLGGIENVRAKVQEIAGAECANAFCKNPQLVSGVLKSLTNDYATFVVAPDGSKEGWDDSARGDKMRDKVIEYLERLRWEDGSTSFAYVEVQYGDDEHETKVCRNSDTRRRRDRKSKVRQA